LAWCGRAIPGTKETGNSRSAIGLPRPVTAGRLCDEVIFVSLQKDVRADDNAILKERADILDYGDALEDFSDTAR
jgi:hypothetical protein